MFMKLIAVILAAIVSTASFAECEAVIHPDFQSFDSSKLADSSFFEQFIGDSLEELGWKVSRAKKNEEFTYLGQWSLEEAQSYPGFKNDKGLVLKKEAAHHAISHKLKEPLYNTNQDLVLQYEVKLQEGLKCGGAYIKLLNEGFEELGEFSNDTPYQIMFGPDVCGSKNKIHLIINRKNPITGEYEEKHLTSTPMSPTNKISTLYTLILKENQQFEIRIDGEVVKAGNILKPKLFEPSFNPPEEIVDEYDMKPFDWDDQRYIIDTSVEKPRDYDMKYLALRIPDPEAVKPDDWDESEQFIADPEAVKPEDWDDEIEWTVPLIVNPKCAISGCGKWKRPTIPNPDYKGPWIPPRISNPKYKGEWKPRVILNPNYYVDETPTNIDSVGGLGFELWSIDKNILFDNIYLGHSIEEAETIGNATFLPKIEIEYADFEVNKPKPMNGPAVPPPTFDDLMDHELDSLSSLRVFMKFLKEIVHRNVGHYTDLVQSSVQDHFLSVTQYYIDFSADPNVVMKADIKKFVLHCLGFISFFTVIFGVLNMLIMMIIGTTPQPKAAEPAEPTEPAPAAQPEEDITEEKIIDLINNRNTAKPSLSTAIRSSNASRRKV